MEQKPTIGRSVHVRTEGGCLPGVVVAVFNDGGIRQDNQEIQVCLFTGTIPEVKNVIEYHSVAPVKSGWHWYQECPDKQ